jgi:hypothetical protein
MYNFKVELSNGFTDKYSVAFATILTNFTVKAHDKIHLRTVLQDFLDGYKVGSGGNHVWIADADNNERIAIIYLYEHTTNEDTFLSYMKHEHSGNNPLLKALMSKEEIKLAERLVKTDLLVKGTSTEKGRNKIIYYYDGA